MQEQMTVDRLDELRGATVYDSAGDKIGKVEEIFWDEETRQPEWIGIGTGFFGTKRVLVPVQGVNASEDGLTVPYSKDMVKDSPDIDDDEISQDLEERLASHYGVAYSERRSNTGMPEGEAASTGYADAGREVESRSEGQIIRSEEELRVGARETTAGRVRLRKRVETEPVQTDVELRRETAHIEREPINEPISGDRIGDEQIEVPLRQEQPVVEKQTVAKERISLDKDVETERETVTDEVRKERVDLDDDASTR